MPGHPSFELAQQGLETRTSQSGGSKALDIDRCHQRQMIRGDAGDGRDIGFHLDQRRTGFDPNAIE